MTTNPYFKQGVTTEQSLYESIIIESLKMYGQDLFYLPRDIVNEDRVFGDDVPSRFNSAYKIEMYIENIEGFDGEGDLFSRFGVEIRDEATFIVAKKRWRSTIGRIDNEINSDRPREGDLIYVPLSKSMFQIMHVEHEQPFYQLNNLPIYKLRCALFEYSDEDLDTGVDEIDAIEADVAHRWEIVLRNSPPLSDVEVNSEVYQNVDSDGDGTGLRVTGEIVQWQPVNKTLYLSHVGSSDGTFQEFKSSKQLVIAGTGYNIASVQEVMAGSSNTQNDDFNQDANDFLDFTETNPFGEPEL